jgi:cell wall-associated NlpC family hydrolase
VTRLEVGVPVTTLWTSPEAPRDLDSPAVADAPDPGAWTAALDAEPPSSDEPGAPSRGRIGLHGRTLTQLLFGEPVDVVEERGAWARVVAPWQPSSADPAGYPGWVRRAHLATPAVTPTGTPAGPAARGYVVARRTSLTFDQQSPGGDVATTAATVELSFGTALALAPNTGTGPGTGPGTGEGDGGGDAVRVLLPGGGTGRLPRVDIACHDPQHADVQDGPAAGLAALEAAARFLGLTYLWGGASAWGLDCSGLVHLVHRALGRHIPRDAFDQADAVEPVPLDAVRPGDLYFFARPGERVYHVGFASRPVGADGTRWMLHAPETGGGIEDAPLAPHRVATLVSAGRVPAAGTPSG